MNNVPPEHDIGEKHLVHLWSEPVVVNRDGIDHRIFFQTVDATQLSWWNEDYAIGGDVPHERGAPIPFNAIREDFERMVRMVEGKED